MTDRGAVTDCGRTLMIRVPLALLAPDIVEAILDGRQPTRMQLERLVKPISSNWEDQSRALGYPEL